LSLCQHDLTLPAQPHKMVYVRSVIQTLLIVFLAASLIFLIYWLWQRQPKEPEPPKQIQSSNLNTQNESQAPQGAFINIKEGAIVSTSTLKISGKTQANAKVLIFSNSLNDIVSASADGTYSIEEPLDSGINLISIVSTDKDFKQIQKQNVSVYLKSKNDTGDFGQMASGSVTKIFEGTITVSTAVGDVNISTSNSTKYVLPTPPPSKSPQPKTSGPDTRVGDFIIALGKSSSPNGLNASQITIIRENKPQITKTYSIVKLASTVKQKLFSGSQTTDNKLIEFTLSKNAQVFLADKKADEKAIQKGKSAIIFYTPQDKDNTASLIYILP